SACGPTSRSWSGTACGTSWRRVARVRSAWGCCPAGMAKKSSSGPARIGCIRTPPTCSITSTRSACAWAARLRRSSREVLVLPPGRRGGQLHHTVPRAGLLVVGPVALAHPGRPVQDEATAEALDRGLVHAAQLVVPARDVGPGPP